MNPLKLIADYFRSVNSELRKVSWPSRRTTLNYSILVIGISLVTAVAFAALDFGFTKLAELGTKARANMTAQTDSQATSTVPTTPSQPVIDFSEVTPITTPTSTN